MSSGIIRSIQPVQVVELPTLVDASQRCGKGVAAGCTLLDTDPCTIVVEKLDQTRPCSA